MAFNLLGFALARHLAKTEGVDENRANLLGIAGSVLAQPVMGAVIVQQVARRETAAATPAPTPAPPATPPPDAPADPPAQVPRLVGQLEAEAVKTLERVGLTSKTEKVTSLEPADHVIEQRPLAGETVAAHSTVSLKVSTGPKPAACSPGSTPPAGAAPAGSKGRS